MVTEVEERVEEVAVLHLIVDATSGLAAFRRTVVHNDNRHAIGAVMCAVPLLSGPRWSVMVNVSVSQRPLYCESCQLTTVHESSSASFTERGSYRWLPGAARDYQGLPGPLVIRNT